MDQAFRNVQPLTRDQRLNARDSEAMQKARIAERTGGHQRYEDPGHVLQPAVGTVAYQGEDNRFGTDFATEDRIRREQERAQRQAVIESRRARMVERDQQRWDQMEGQHMKEESKLNNMASKWQAGQKNNSSQAYNPITLEYDPTEQGMLLHQADQKKKAWENARMANIDSKQNSNYNILTGETRQQFERF